MNTCYASSSLVRHGMNATDCGYWGQVDSPLRAEHDEWEKAGGLRA